MNKKQYLKQEKQWTKAEREKAEERQKQRFLAYINSGLSLTKWIEERMND